MQLRSVYEVIRSSARTRSSSIGTTRSDIWPWKSESVRPQGNNVLHVGEEKQNTKTPNKPGEDERRGWIWGGKVYRGVLCAILSSPRGRSSFHLSLYLSHSLSFSVSSTANEAAILSNMKTPGDTGKFSHTTTTPGLFNPTLDCRVKKIKRLIPILVSCLSFLGEFLPAFASR